ncbi:MAG: ribonuclease J [Deltaproteobacteria bacterium]|nr:ribonuclease J [Deltaproteobacteria bacterium]MBW2661094.1 ribonuclease J [Deltaproteobacteria bacterium]
MLRIIPLGGLGEIGLNMMLFEYEDTLFIVDVGLMFPEDYMLGIDIVIPNFDYLKQNNRKVAGIVLTHAHEDHIGALPYLLRKIKAPIFGTPFTLGIVRNKLEEHKLLESVSMHEVLPGEKINIGVFELEFIHVCHSIVGGVGIAIKTPVGLIIHTGDFKICHTPFEGVTTDVNRFASYGEKGVLALLSDSTNVEKEGYTISDQEVGETLAKIAKNSKGRIIVALFASNITRIQQIVVIAAARGRRVVFDGRSIRTNVKIAKELGYIHVPGQTEIDIEQINDFPDDNILIITTGSQGEPMSALARMATGRHKYLKIKKNDTVVLSSKFIPGNEKAITKIINSFYRQGADVIYEKISDIHVSGHAFQEELKLMINLTKPEYFIPIHGEFRHLILHSRLAEQVGIPKERILIAENGNTIEFDENGGRIKDKVKTGRVLVDGKGIGDIGWSVLKERRILSEDGVVAVNMAFDNETGIIVYGPEIVSRGFVFETETGHLLEDAKCVILEIVEDVNPETPDRIDRLRSMIRKGLREYFYFTIKRHPVILPFILEI